MKLEDEVGYIDWREVCFADSPDGVVAVAFIDKNNKIYKFVLELEPALEVAQGLVDAVIRSKQRIQEH